MKPSPEPSAPGDAFAPPLGAAAASGTPEIAEWTRTAGPDESLVLTGSKFSKYSSTEEGKDSRFLVYGSNGMVKDAKIQRLDGDKAIITLDKGLPAWSMYLLWPFNETGYGRPVAINKTDGWWVGPDKATKGGSVSVYGRNLSHNNGTSTSYVYIKPAGAAGQWAQVTAVNPYKVTFTVPANLANGDYEVWVHNGHGGEYGWSGPLKLNVYDGPKWSGTVVNVKTHGATGNGSSDDRAAINKAIAAAGSAGNTVYLPAGTYMVSGALNINSNTKWLGDVDASGKPTTIIKLMPGFVSGSFGLVGNYNLTNNQFENIKFVRNGQSLNQDFIDMRNTYMMWWVNCEIDARGADALRFASGSRNIYMSKTTVIGGSGQWGNVVLLDGARQFFADGCTFKMTNDCAATFSNKGVREASITNCTVMDLDNTTTDGSGWGKGRIWVANGGGGGGSTYHCYFDGIAGKGLGVRRSGSNLPDINSGEVFLWESYTTNFSGYVSSATSNSVTLSGSFPKNSKLSMAIIDGKGMGQFRRVVKDGGSTLTIDRPWEVLPDATSKVLVGPYVERIVIYKNTIDANGKPYVASNPIASATASAGIQPYGGCFDVIADNNTMTGLGKGISNWATQHWVIDPNFFCLFTNNKIINCRVGIQNASEVVKGEGTVAVLGTMYRKNTIQNPIATAIHNELKYAGEPIYNAFVYEHNTITGAPAGFSTGSLSNPDPRYITDEGFEYGSSALKNQVLYNNDFINLSSAVKVSPGIALRENTYQGVSPIYTGILPGGVIEAPSHVVEISGELGGEVVKSPFVLYNSGTGAMNWQASSNASWLTLSQGSGIIKNEVELSTIELSANPQGLPEGTHKANITVIATGMKRIYTVLFTVNSPINGSVFPILNSAPTVSLSISAPTFIAPASITLTAPASDTDSSINKVEFYNGSTKLGEDVSAPYSYSWSNVAAGTYSLTAKATNDSGLSTTSEALSVTIDNTMVLQSCSDKGGISWDYWWIYSGVTGRPDSISVPATAPNGSKVLSTFANPLFIGDHFVSRTRGYICPPSSGNYVFYMSANEWAELWLSTDDQPANKKKIITVSTPDAYPGLYNMQSETVYLQAGRRYYVEALQMEQSGSDHLEVGWALPDRTMQRPIPGANLIPFNLAASQVATASGSLTMMAPAENKVGMKWEEGKLAAGGDALSIYPNPFQQQTTIEFSVSESGHAVLQVYNLQGALVGTQFEGMVEAGRVYKKQLDGSRLPSGSYICRLSIQKSQSISQKGIIIFHSPSL